MEFSINEIKKDIHDAIGKYLEIRIEDDDKNLLSSDFHVVIPDFLYVFKELERKYGSSIYRLFEENNYSVFTVNGLAQAILDLAR